MLKKSVFFDFLNRRDGEDFDSFMARSTEDEHYIEWNEYALPHHYGDAQSEYHEIRSSCALFDVSPIRKIRIRGTGAGEFFDRLLTRPVKDLPAMRATYVVFCTENGDLKDDAILYKFANDDYLLMPSDVDHSPYFESLCERFDVQNVTFTEYTDSLAGLAIQGPLSATVLQNMGFDNVASLKPFEVRNFAFENSSIRISRVGFTADLGYECWFKPSLADSFANRIASLRDSMGLALPGYGLDPLQACRIEGGFIVAGWDCATEIDPQPGFERTPYELGLGWLVNLDAADFVGRDALETHSENGPRYVLRSAQIEGDACPTDGAPVFSDESGHSEIGLIACSSWSWGLEKVIGNASINANHAAVTDAWILVDGGRTDLKLGSSPLVNLDRRNEVPAAIIA